MNGFTQWLDRVLPARRRRMLHGLMPALVTILATFGMNENIVTLWVAAGAALLGAGIAAFNAENAWRRWLYGLLGPVQAILVFYGAIDQNQAVAFGAIVATVLGFGVAAAYTPAGAAVDELQRRAEAIAADVNERAENVAGDLAAMIPDSPQLADAKRNAEAIRDFLRGGKP